MSSLCSVISLQVSCQICILTCDQCHDPERSLYKKLYVVYLALRSYKKNKDGVVAVVRYKYAIWRPYIDSINTINKPYVHSRLISVRTSRTCRDKKFITIQTPKLCCELSTVNLQSWMIRRMFLARVQ